MAKKTSDSEKEKKGSEPKSKGEDRKTTIKKLSKKEDDSSDSWKKPLVWIGLILSVAIIIFAIIQDSSTDRKPEKNDNYSQNTETREKSGQYIDDGYKAGDEIHIPREGILYKRKPYLTYWERASDHIIFESTLTGKRYYFGPQNKWEPKAPGETVIEIPPPTLNYMLYPNEAYGVKSAKLQIAKITPNQ